MTKHKFDRFLEFSKKEYELVTRSIPHHDQLQEKVGEIVKRFAQPKSKDTFRIVEAGPGTGFTTTKILEADPRISVLAVDTDEHFLTIARGELKEFSNRIDFKHQDILSALQKTRNESFDAFVSAYTIHNLPSNYRQRLFPEIHRTLKAGGLFVNADKYARDDKEKHKQDLAEQMKDFDQYVDMGYPELKEKMVEHYLEDEKIKITEGGQVKILKDLGFKNIEVVYRERMEAIIVAYKLI